MTEEEAKAELDVLCELCGYLTSPADAYGKCGFFFFKVADLKDGVAEFATNAVDRDKKYRVALEAFKKYLEVLT